MKKKKKNFLDQVAHSSPDMREIVQEIKHDYRTGVIRHIPRSIESCTDWQDGWLYIFHRVSLHPTDFIYTKDDKVIRVVWVGKEFTDDLIETLLKLEKLLGPHLDLMELRLVGTNITETGKKRIKVFIPHAAITVFSEEDGEHNPRLWYADPVEASEMYPDDNAR